MEAKCIYCKYEGTYVDGARKTCPLSLKGECNRWSKEKFEPLEDWQIEKIDAEIRRKEEQYREADRRYRLCTIGIAMWIIGIIMLLIVGVLSVIYQFSHPDMTRTQLIIYFCTQAKYLVPEVLGIVLIIVGQTFVRKS